MPPITQANVQVMQGNEDENFEQFQRWHCMTPQISFGNSTLTYDTYGIPVPDLVAFRLTKAIYRMTATPESPIDGKVYQWDRTVRTANPVAPNGTIRIFSSGVEFTGAPPPVVLDLFITGA